VIQVAPKCPFAFRILHTLARSRWHIFTHDSLALRRREPRQSVGLFPGEKLIQQYTQ